MSIKKKLLSIVCATFFVAGSTSIVVSCKTSKKEPDYKIKSKEKNKQSENASKNIHNLK